MTEYVNSGKQPVSVSAGRGAAWLIEGFVFFQQYWIAWIAVALILIIISLIVSAIPFVNLLPNLFMPVLLAGLMIGCKEQDAGGEFNPGHLFAGFSDRLGQYLLLGLIYTGGIIVIGVLVLVLLIILLGGMGFIASLESDPFQFVFAYYLYFVIVILVGMFLYVPLIMAFWFAPVLVALGEQDVVEAMKNSFRACLLNVVPYLVYGVVGLVFSIIATIPLGLGWLILFPVITISVYLSYKDIFTQSGDIS